MGGGGSSSAPAFTIRRLKSTSPGPRLTAVTRKNDAAYQPIVCSRLLQVYQNEQHVKAVSMQLRTQMEKHNSVFEQLEQTARQAAWGDLPTEQEDCNSVQKLTSEAYLHTVETLHQANQDVLQTLRKPKVHRRNGLEWPMSAETEQISVREQQAACM